MELKALRAVLHVLQVFALVSPSGAFGPAAFSSRLLSKRSWQGGAPVSAVPDPAGNDAAQRALEQAAKLRQEVADLEEKLAKGWYECALSVSCFEVGEYVTQSPNVSNEDHVFRTLREVYFVTTGTFERPGTLNMFLT